MKRKMVAVLLSGILAASSLTCVQVGGALVAVAAETSETKTFKIERTNVPMYNDDGVSIILESCNYTQDASDITFIYDVTNESKSIVTATMDDLLVDGVEMSMLLGRNSFEAKAGERWAVSFYIAMDDLKNAGISDFAQITYTLNISLGDEQVASIPIVIERKESTVTSDAGNDEAVKTLESEKAELEEKVSQLESENASLESENNSLKKQVEELKNGEATDQTETDEQTESADETESAGKEQTEDSKPEKTEENVDEETEATATEASVGVPISEFVSKYNYMADGLSDISEVEQITEKSVRIGRIVKKNNTVIEFKKNSNGNICGVKITTESGEKSATYELLTLIGAFDDSAVEASDTLTILNKALNSESSNSKIIYKKTDEGTKQVLEGTYISDLEEEVEEETEAKETTETKETKAKETSVGMPISEFVSRYNTAADGLASLSPTKIAKITEDSVRSGKIITNNNGIIKLKIDSDDYIYEMSFEEEYGENKPTYELITIVSAFDNSADNALESTDILQKALDSESPNNNIRYKEVGDNDRLILSGVYNTKNNVPLEDKTSVARVQRALNKLGYNCGTADGILGSNTQKAIVAFQKNNDLTPTGEITQELLQKLSWNSATSSSTNSKRSLEDYSNTLVQNLKSLAIYNPIEVTDKVNNKYGLEYTLKFKGIEISLEFGESDDKEEFWIIAFNKAWDKEPFYDFAAYLVQAVSPEIDAYDAYTIVINANAADGYQKNGCHYTGVDGADLVIENIPR